MGCTQPIEWEMLHGNTMIDQEMSWFSCKFLENPNGFGRPSRPPITFPVPNTPAAPAKESKGPAEATASWHAT